MIIITNGFDRLSNPKLAARTDQICVSMSANAAIFPSPVPSILSLSEQLEAFQLAMAKAAEGSKVDKELRNQLREEVIDMLHQLSAYVLNVANGDVAKALASGFKVKKTPAPTPDLEPADGLKLEDGALPGELALKFNRVKYAKSYEYQITPDPLTANSQWTSATGTQSKHLFQGLQSNTKYWCRVVAIGVRNQKQISSPVSRTAQ